MIYIGLYTARPVEFDDAAMRHSRAYAAGGGMQAKSRRIRLQLMTLYAFHQLVARRLMPHDFDALLDVGDKHFAANFQHFIFH